MSLRRRLIYLLASFAGFALLAAFGTIYGIQMRVDSIIGSFQRSVDQAHQVDQLRIDAREQFVKIRELTASPPGTVADEHSNALRLALQEQRAALQRLSERIQDMIKYAPLRDGSGTWNQVQASAAELHATLGRCLDALEAGRHDEAVDLLAAYVEPDLWPQLDKRLRQVRRALDETRNRTVEELSTTGALVLALALVISAAGAGLTVIGAALIRRWLILPIDRLRVAAREFGEGHLDYRTGIASPDELGQLAGALNQMAASLEDAQSRLQRAEAMQATVTLAQGVAHDFNNLLTSATGTLALLEADLREAKQVERLRRAQRACWQAASLSRELLDFARGDRGHPQLLCLRETVDLILNSLEENFFEGVRLHCDLEPTVLVNVDCDQLTHIVLNLVQNAREAMPNGGELRIKVAAQGVPSRAPSRLESPLATPPERAAHSGRTPRYGVLSVSDTGCGMTRQVERRIFEPFFTTKSRGARRGRGMGLAIVYAAVKNADGFIEVDSRVGVGTTFRVYLPLGEGALPSAEPAAFSIAPLRATGAVLVVDDDPLIRQMCVDAFEKWGCTVLTAAGAREAQQRFGQSPGGHIELALIDVNLPDGSGIDLAERLVGLQPELLLVFTTGADGLAIPPALHARVRARLIKPFTLESLARAVSPYAPSSGLVSENM
jgi:signal transduction histidine kinase/ActR/RegA family two-component response regulator